VSAIDKFQAHVAELVTGATAGPWEQFEGEILNADGLPILCSPRGEWPNLNTLELAAASRTLVEVQAEMLREAREQLSEFADDDWDDSIARKRARTTLAELDRIAAAYLEVKS
jgi:hypothetical protein